MGRRYITELFPIRILQILYDKVMPPTLSTGLMPHELQENGKWRRIRENAGKVAKIVWVQDTNFPLSALNLMT